MFTGARSDVLWRLHCKLQLGITALEDVPPGPGGSPGDTLVLNFTFFVCALCFTQRNGYFGH